MKNSQDIMDEALLVDLATMGIEVANAIRLERERCAKIAEYWYRKCGYAEDVCADIATAIRGK